MKSTLSILFVLLIGSASSASYFSYDSATYSSLKDTAGKFHRSFYFKGPINYHSNTGEAIPVSNRSNSYFVCSALTGLSWRDQDTTGSNYIGFAGFGPIKPAYTNFTVTVLVGSNGDFEKAVYQDDPILHTPPYKGINLGMRDLSCNYISNFNF